jgi:hypothetical protein
MTDYLYLPTNEEAERIRKELKARGVTEWDDGAPIGGPWIASRVVYYVKGNRVHTKDILATPGLVELNNATLAKIPKPEPCVVIRHEVQEEGVLRLLDELGVRWMTKGSASEFVPSKDATYNRCDFPYKLIFNEFLDITWGQMSHGAKPQSTKDFMEGVKNALL